MGGVMRRGVMATAAGLLMLGGGAAQAAVTLGDTFGIAIVGYDHSTVVDGIAQGGYLLSRQTVTFGTTQVFKGYAGQAITMTSSQKVGDATTTNFFSISTPVNFLNAATLDGVRINAMSFAFGGGNAGLNAVSLTGPITSISGLGQISYSVSSSLTNTPTLVLSPDGQSYSGASTVSTSATSGLYQFAIRQFDVTVTYANPVAPVPEPATWAMMIVGFGAVGASLRRQRRALSAIA